MEVLITLWGIFRHFRVRQFADRIGKQRGAAIVAVLTDITFRVALDLRHAGGVQVFDDFIDRRLLLVERGDADLYQAFDRRAVFIFLSIQGPDDAVDDFRRLAQGEGDAVFVHLAVG